MELSSKLNLNKVEGRDGAEVFELDFTTQKNEKPYELDETGLSVYLSQETAFKLAWNILRSLGAPEKWNEEDENG